MFRRAYLAHTIRKQVPGVGELMAVQVGARCTWFPMLCSCGSCWRFPGPEFARNFCDLDFPAFRRKLERSRVFTPLQLFRAALFGKASHSSLITLMLCVNTRVYHNRTGCKTAVEWTCFEPDGDVDAVAEGSRSTETLLAYLPDLDFVNVWQRVSQGYSRAWTCIAIYLPSQLLTGSCKCAPRKPRYLKRRYKRLMCFVI